MSRYFAPIYFDRAFATGARGTIRTRAPNGLETALPLQGSTMGCLMYYTRELRVKFNPSNNISILKATILLYSFKIRKLLPQ